MGKSSAAKRPTRGVRDSITNYELQITNLKHFFQCFVFLCALCSFAGNIFAQNSIETFSEIIERGNTEQKRDALYQIRNLETESASRIAIPALKDSSEIVRATAAFSVIYLPKDEAFQVLLPLLTDKNEFVRRETAYALGKVRNPQAINYLIQVFQKDKSDEVKNVAVVALGEIGDVSAVDFLTRILQKKPKKENAANDFLRRSAARAIGEIAQIIQTGKIEVVTPKDFLPDKFVLFTPPNFLYLSRNLPVFLNANNTLIQTLQNNRESLNTRREAAFALGAIGEESAIPILQANLNNQNYYLAEIVKESLRKIQFVQILRQNAEARTK
ncbi:MAG: HEAT repeat domain-containing protein [Acidobacteriota bacterium]